MKLKSLEHYWYSKSPLVWLLLPLSGIVFILSSVRRTLYHLGLLRRYRSPILVIIVGNISVGGTGKTPLVVWLSQFLREQGFRPGIINRGYKGKTEEWPQQVTATSDARQVGDEAVLLAQRTGCPVVAGPKRIDSVRVIEQLGCDVVISDDGLQHYALQRDIEIAVMDGERRVGNGFLLPAGPLREGVDRLEAVDFVVCNGGKARAGEFRMEVAATEAISLANSQTRRPLSAFSGKKVVAVAGIGNPERFFTTLKQASIEVTRRVFPDHHHYTAAELQVADATLLMTEKDAVKCRTIAPPGSWYVPAAALINDDFTQHLQMCIKKLKKKD